MPVEAAQQIQKEMQINWGLKPEDLLAILILLIVTLGITTYFQYIITSGLENAEYISIWLASP